MKNTMLVLIFVVISTMAFGQWLSPVFVTNFNGDAGSWFTDETTGAAWDLNYNYVGGSQDGDFYQEAHMIHILLQMGFQ